MIDNQLLLWIVGAVAMVIGAIIGIEITAQKWLRKLKEAQDQIEWQEEQINKLLGLPLHTSNKGTIHTKKESEIMDEIFGKVPTEIMKERIGPLDKPYEEYTVDELNELYGNPLGYPTRWSESHPEATSGIRGYQHYEDEQPSDSH